MKIIDLTQTISAKMQVFPGTEPPVITNATTIENDGFAEKLLSFFSHTGTHVDAPGHILESRFTLDQFDAGKFIGKGMVIWVYSGFVKSGMDENLMSEEERKRIFPKDGIIEKESLEQFAPQIEKCDFVLFRTDWSRLWGCEGYFNDFPTLSHDSAKWLSSFNLKGIGFDCISADPVDAPDLPNHRIILDKNLIIIENLCSLDKLTGVEFLFSCLPLKIEDSDGSPVRAIGAVEINDVL